jgi:glycerophosphoryl diester phosphodiesterase
MAAIKGSPLVLGHRGYRARFPENTLLAFREALKAGADGVECDVQKSADGRFVIAHDGTTDRVTGTPGEIGRMSFDELRRLDFGSGERIPGIDEFLAMLPAETYLDLEVKDETLVPEDCPRIAEILDAHRDRRNLMVSSFDASLLYPFKRRGFTVGYLIGDEVLSGGAFAFARTLLTLRPQYLNLPVQMFEKIGRVKSVRLLRFFRVLGFAQLFWTVNTPEQAADIAEFARIIVTDEVERMLGVVGKEPD